MLKAIISILLNSGRLTKEQIEKMCKDAELFANDDREVKAKIDARNALEGYVYSIKVNIDNPPPNMSLSPADMQTLRDATK